MRYLGCRQSLYQRDGVRSYPVEWGLKTPGKRALPEELTMANGPRIEIHYCEQCRWLLRAAWYAQELLTTFAGQLGEVALVPGRGGVFQVYCDSVLLWDRTAQEGFPDAKDLKQRVRDVIAPGQPLGHSDR